MVDARLFGQLTRKLPGEQVEFVMSQGDGAATVRSGRAEFALDTRDASRLSQAARASRRRRVDHRVRPSCGT